MKEGAHTALTLSIDDGRVTVDHVACTVWVQLWDGRLFRQFISRSGEERTYGESLEGRDDTVGETGDGTLSQIGNDVGNGVRLSCEEVVDFL